MADDPGDERWFSPTVAEHLGVELATVHRYHSAGLIPPADGFDGKRPWWWPATIRAHKDGHAERVADGRRRAAVTRSFYPPFGSARRSPAPGRTTTPVPR